MASDLPHGQVLVGLVVSLVAIAIDGGADMDGSSGISPHPQGSAATAPHRPDVGDRDGVDVRASQ